MFRKLSMVVQKILRTKPCEERPREKRLTGGKIAVGKYQKRKHRGVRTGGKYRFPGFQGAGAKKKHRFFFFKKYVRSMCRVTRKHRVKHADSMQNGCRSEEIEALNYIKLFRSEMDM